MKTRLIKFVAPGALVLLSACSLGGCSSTLQGQLVTMMQNDLPYCDRNYTAALGSGGAGLAAPSANASVTINCKAKPFATPVATAPAPVLSPSP